MELQDSLSIVPLTRLMQVILQTQMRNIWTQTLNLILKNLITGHLAMKILQTSQTQTSSLILENLKRGGEIFRTMKICRKFHNLLLLSTLHIFMTGRSMCQNIPVHLVPQLFITPFALLWLKYKMQHIFPQDMVFFHMSRRIMSILHMKLSNQVMGGRGAQN